MGLLQKILDAGKNGPYSEIKHTGASPTTEEMVAAGMEELKKIIIISVDSDGDSHLNVKIKNPEELLETIQGVAKEINGFNESGVISNHDKQFLKNMLAKEMETIEMGVVANNQITPDYDVGNSTKKKFSIQKAEAVVDVMLGIGKDKSTNLTH